MARRERWNAFLPWPQVLRAQCLAEADRWDEAGEDAEHAFVLACELGDPCWEGMAARALGLLALHAGDLGAAHVWLTDARRRCDRVPDRYVWISAYIGLAQLETAARENTSWSHPLRPGSTSTRYVATCRSSWPGRWCTRPSPATVQKSRWHAVRLLASSTPFCRPGSRLCRAVSPIEKADRKQARNRLRDAAHPARQLRHRHRRRARVAPPRRVRPSSGICGIRVRILGADLRRSGASALAIAWTTSRRRDHPACSTGGGRLHRQTAG